MENVIKSERTDEISGEHNSTFIPESCNVTTMMGIPKKELNLSALDIETDNQQSMEIYSDLDEKREKRVQGLFAAFSHHMRPDPEYIRLEFERSSYDQEAATKVINDRYKLIMENSIRRKEKEEKDKIKYDEILRTMAQHAVSETVHVSQYLSPEDIRKTTHLLSNMYITPDTLKKDQNDAEKIVTFSQVSQKLGSAKCKKVSNLLCDVFIGSFFEDFKLIDEDENEFIGRT